jgi:DNA-binding protein YbaB
MKKFILLFLIVFISGVSQAQLLRGAGIKLGLTIANQDWDHTIIAVDPNSRAGFNIGVFAEFLDMPVFSVVAELNYVQKGVSDLEAEIADQLFDGSVRLNYLNISALGKLRMDFIAVSPYLVAGPKLDIELSRDAVVNNLVIDNFKKERLGFKIGLGTEIHLMFASVLVEVLYDADFNELYNRNNLSISTRSYDIRLGVMF